MRIERIIALAISCTVVISSVVGAMVFLDTRHAPMKDFVELASSYQQFSLEQRLWSYRQRLWYLQEKLGKDCGPAKNECRWLMKEIASLERMLRK